jgi:hypothetical protein
MLVNFAVILTTLLAFCGLALDAGLMELKQIQLQNAADAAAMGAAAEFERGSSQSIWITAGRADASLNGFTDGQNGATVTLANPPAAGTYANSNQAIQSSVTQVYSPIFFPQSVQLSAQATALGGSEPCSYFLSRVSKAPSLSLSGSTLNANCSLYMAASMSVSSSSANSSGQFRVSGPASASSLPGTGVSPIPIFNAAVEHDPLSTVVSPAFSGCTHTGGTKYVGNVTIYPGTYCGGLSLGVGGSNGNFTMSPGLYIVTGGMTVSGSMVSGSGVTIFLTQGGGSGYGPLTVNQSQFFVSAPAGSGGSGIPSVLVFADRNWNTGATAVAFSGSHFQGDGVFYLPETALALQGTEFYASNYLGVVADSASMSGSEISLKNNFSAASAGDPYEGNVSLVQ